MSQSWITSPQIPAVFSAVLMLAAGGLQLQACASRPCPQTQVIDEQGSTTRQPRQSSIASQASHASPGADCENREGLVIAAEDPITLDCAPELSTCNQIVELRAINCGAEPLQRRSLTVEIAGVQTRLDYSNDVTSIPHGGGWAIPVSLNDKSKGQELSAILRTGEGQVLKTSLVLAIRRPKLEQAQAKCSACQGVWSSHGMSGAMSCNCRTRDRGSQCLSGRDCEGDCLYHHTETIATTSPPCDDTTNCSASPEAKRLVGYCSEFAVSFGCHDLVPDDAKPGPWAVPVRLCRD